MRFTSRLKPTLTLSLLLILIVALTLFGSTRFTTQSAHAATSTYQSSNKIANSCGSWSVVPSPNPSTYNYLNGVTAISANDAWAVGYYDGTGVDGNLTEHWNGTSWTIVPSPSLPIFDTLTSVSAVSSNDVWAVGEYDGNRGETPHAIHWDGTSWSTVTMPVPTSGGYVYLQGVTTVATNDVWAAGYYYDNRLQYERTLAEHWNGTAWSIVATPDTKQVNQRLQGLAAIATNDVWAVGFDISSGGGGSPITEHWNGSKWSIIPSINGFRHTSLYGVARVPGTNQVWAVGYSSYGYRRTRAFEERWNGKSWTQVATISPSSGYNIFNAVAPTAMGNIWAEGSQGNTYFDGNELLSEHWNKTSNSVVSNPGPGSNINLFFGAAAVPGTNQVWAVGYYENTGGGAGDQTLIEFYC